MIKKTTPYILVVIIAVALVVVALMFWQRPAEAPTETSESNTPNSSSEVQDNTQAGNTEETEEDSEINTQEYVGLTEEAAVAKAKAAAHDYRIVARDGEQFPVTMDYRPDRLNFTIEDNVVTTVTLN